VRMAVLLPLLDPMTIARLSLLHRMQVVFEFVLCIREIKSVCHAI
jgi:hypothetical protein